MEFYQQIPHPEGFGIKFGTILINCKTKKSIIMKTMNLFKKSVLTLILLTGLSIPPGKWQRCRISPHS